MVTYAKKLSTAYNANSFFNFLAEGVLFGTIYMYSVRSTE